MHIYHSAVELLLQQPAVQRWPLLGETIQRANAHPPVAWDLPAIGCAAAGGAAQAAIPAVAAVTCAHIAIVLIDDILDEDPRGLYRQTGAGRAANLATALYSLGLPLLQGCSQPGEATAAYGELIGGTAYGQDLDVQNVHSEEGYWQVARAKSSPYFAAGLALGALFGGVAAEAAAQLKQFGALFGEVMQIHDDLNDCLASPANADWLLGRAPLPLLYAELVEHPQRQRFLELRAQAAQPGALQEAQAILVSSGAISYCVSELLARQQALEGLLAGMQLADPQPLQALLRQTLAPVQHLFTAVGAQLPI